MRRFLVLERIFSTVSYEMNYMEEPVQDFDSEEEAIAWVNDQSIPESFRIEDQMQDFDDYFNDDYYPERDDFYPVSQDPDISDTFHRYEDLEDVTDDSESLYDDDMGE